MNYARVPLFLRTVLSTTFLSVWHWTDGPPPRSFNALIYQGEEEGCKARRRESKSNRPPLSSSCRKPPGETNQRKYSNGEGGKAKHCTPNSVLCSGGTNQNQPLILSPSFLLPPTSFPGGFPPLPLPTSNEPPPLTLSALEEKGRGMQSKTFLFPGKTGNDSTSECASMKLL